MRMLLSLILILLACQSRAADSRLVIDDDAYVDKVVAGAHKLRGEHKLATAEHLRQQVQTRTYPMELPAASQKKLEAPDLHDLLAESTLAIGSYYKCPDCGDWHFDGSAGFVIAEKGVVCTCCHVILGEDDGVKQSYLVAADARGRVYPVRSVLAADTESDTCWVQIDATGLKPLPLRSGVRTGEKVFCLSHPGGYYFMFTQGMVARLNLRRNEVLDAHGKPTEKFTRPILFLNVTAEFAPGSSGAPIVDECGNVVGQVASIADAGETDVVDEGLPPSPSVPVRFCTAAEELGRPAEKTLPVADSRKVLPRKVNGHSAPKIPGR